MGNIESKIAVEGQLPELKKLSTEGLIIWLIGRSEELDVKLSIEDIALECWFINPEKHSLRGYPQYPDSFVVMKRVFDMKGRKGLVEGTTNSGFRLTTISHTRYNEILRQINHGTKGTSPTKGADRTISSIDEAPYKRLVRTSAYLKYIENKKEQIVESDFLYFYGINWHSRKALIEGRIRNIDTVINEFTDKDPILKEVRDFLNSTFSKTKEQLTK